MILAKLLVIVLQAADVPLDAKDLLDLRQHLLLQPRAGPDLVQRASIRRQRPGLLPRTVVNVPQTKTKQDGLVAVLRPRQEPAARRDGLRKKALGQLQLHDVFFQVRIVGRAAKQPLPRRQRQGLLIVPQVGLAQKLADADLQLARRLLRQGAFKIGDRRVEIPRISFQRRLLMKNVRRVGRLAQRLGVALKRADVVALFLVKQRQQQPVVRDAGLRRTGRKKPLQFLRRRGLEPLVVEAVEQIPRLRPLGQNLQVPLCRATRPHRRARRRRSQEPPHQQDRAHGVVFFRHRRSFPQGHLAPGSHPWGRSAEPLRQGPQAAPAAASPHPQHTHTTVRRSSAGKTR